MKIPAIKGRIGDWDYYISTLTFQQVNDYVSRVDDELHKSESLKELIQRSITNNFLSIKKYIINQPELFFNSLVLAVYDDYPEWVEIEVKYDDLETYQLGLLDFPSNHKIFPVDGQHRVEGIKAALQEKAALADMKISVIFIGHKNDENGLKRTRRLFSTLNRYAKPVTMDDIIALDEDDSIAIATRNLLETNLLFTGKKVTKSKNKAISTDDKHSFTSIITLYECNRELLKYHRKCMKKNAPDTIRDKKSFNEYLKFRPEEDDLASYEELCNLFWNDFINNFEYIKEYSIDNSINPSEKFRNNIEGGNLLFRPIALLPFVQCVLELNTATNKSFDEIFQFFGNLNLNLNQKPWKQVLWNDFQKTMIMGNKTLVKYILKYKFDENILKPYEMSNLLLKYAQVVNFQGDNIEDVLVDIK
ncbi:DNA sulfur modification protein DndB [Flavobacterium sp.]|uniref:DGQHR domain-containing protein n=1 Tax=Flavobacterium sp. TaxID=239 RepID=UPI0032639A57